ncbi:MAG: hypothetical protein ACRDO1_14560 [Nocardioidaceae bacterium]|nr:hypothetical protein [Propionibacteriales bacterium]
MAPDDDSILVDCDSCAVRGDGCADCVVTVLLGAPPEVHVDADEARALDVLAASGLVPPLRMVTPLDGPEIASA